MVRGLCMPPSQGFYCYPAVAVKRRYHGDTFEFYPRKGGLEDSLANLKMPINWNVPPTSGVDRNSRFLYPHVHLLPTGDWYLQQRTWGP